MTIWPINTTRPAPASKRMTIRSCSRAKRRFIAPTPRSVENADPLLPVAPSSVRPSEILRRWRSAGPCSFDQIDARVRRRIAQHEAIGVIVGPAPLDGEAVTVGGDVAAND